MNVLDSRSLLYLLCGLILALSICAAPSLYAQPAAMMELQYKAIGRGVVGVEGGIIELSAQKDGLIKEVLVEEGDKVTKGQVLAIQDDSVAIPSLDIARADVRLQKAQLTAQRAQLTTLKNQAKRLKPLVEIEAEPRNNYEEILDRINELNKQIAATSISVEIARKRVQTAESDLEQFKIKAPLDGEIIKRFARPGVGASTLNVSTLFWLAPDVPMQIKLTMQSKYHDMVQAGDKVMIQAVENQSIQSSGYVVRVNKVLTPSGTELGNMNDPYADKYFECVIAFDDETGFTIGQNVIVKFRDTATGQL